jgi:O-antigen/teichoic acid export membrane protein
MPGFLIDRIAPYLNYRSYRSPSLAFQTVQVFLTRVGGRGLTLLSILTLTRWLGLTAFGRYTYIVSWVAILTIPSLGMETLVVREAAFARRRNDADGFGGLLRWSVGNTLWVSGAVTLGGLIAVFIYALGASQGVQLSTILGLAGIPLICLQTLAGAVFRGCRQTGLTAFLSDIISPAVMTVWAGSCLMIGIRASTSMALSGWLAILSLVLLIYVFLLPRLNFKWRWNSAVPDQIAAWRKSLVSLTMLKGITIAAGRLPLILLGLFIGPEPVALFSLSFRIAGFVCLTLSIVSMTIAPRLAELQARQDRAAMQRLVTRSTMAISAWAIPVAVILILFGRWILGWFGPQFKAGYPFLLVLLVGQAVDAVTGNVSLVMNMAGMERVVARVHAAGFILTTGICLLLIPRWGAMGAAIGATSALVFSNVFLAVYLYRRLGITTVWPARAPRTL